MKNKYTLHQPGKPSNSPKAAAGGHFNLTNVTPVPRSRLLPGTVVWAHIPFSEGGGETTRPAVVLDLRGRDVTLLPATTSDSRRRYPERYVEVNDFDAAGFTRPTGIRRTPVTVDLIEVINIIGSLSDLDAERALGELADVA